jgi:hypothetical protein
MLVGLEDHGKNLIAERFQESPGFVVTLEK